MVTVPKQIALHSVTPACLASGETPLRDKLHESLRGVTPPYGLDNKCVCSMGHSVPSIGRRLRNSRVSGLLENFCLRI